MSHSKPQLGRKLEEDRATLLAAIDGLNEEQITRIPIVGEWTIKDLFGHIAYWEGVILDHVRQSFTEGRPRPVLEDEMDASVNPRQTAKRKHRSWPRVKAEFENVRQAQKKASDNKIGYDVLRDEYMNMVKGGVIGGNVLGLLDQRMKVRGGGIGEEHGPLPAILRRLACVVRRELVQQAGALARRLVQKRQHGIDRDGHPLVVKRKRGRVDQAGVLVARSHSQDRRRGNLRCSGTSQHQPQLLPAILRQPSLRV